jgi:tRNA A-37 threonylcarbamoyl transferase component Bud32
MAEGGVVAFEGAGGLRWTATAEDADWVRDVVARDPDGLHRLPGATLAKKNLLREVWRVPREGGPAMYVKRFRVSAIRDAAKYLFVPSRARSEWEASRGMRAAGIPAAEVTAMAEHRAGGILRDAAAVVREFPAAEELVPWLLRRWPGDGPWEGEAGRARRDFLARIGKLLRQVHDAGFLHPDLHGGNLLVAREGEPPALCVIDLHGVKRPGTVGADSRESDLVKLLHSLRTATTPAERAWIAESYGGGASPERMRAVEAGMASLEEKRVRSRTTCAKLLRPTGRFDVARRGGVRWVFLRTWGVEPFAKALEEHARVAADGKSERALKRGGRSTVTRVEVAGPEGRTPLVVKETKFRGTGDFLKNLLRRPRAVSSWMGGNGLWIRGYPVAVPMAVAVRGSWPSVRESWLVMEDVSAVGERFDLRALRLWGSGPLGRAAAAEKRRAAERAGRFVGDLHARGIYHGDFKAVNLFVRPWRGGEAFALVDYDRVDFGPPPLGLRRRVKNLAQLAASLGTYFTRADRLRFYRVYAARLPGAWEARKDVARAVAAACARKIVVRREPIE